MVVRIEERPGIDRVYRNPGELLQDSELQEFQLRLDGWPRNFEKVNQLELATLQPRNCLLVNFESEADRSWFLFEVGVVREKGEVACFTGRTRINHSPDHYGVPDNRNKIDRSWEVEIYGSSELASMKKSGSIEVGNHLVVSSGWGNSEDVELLPEPVAAIAVSKECYPINPV